MSDMLNAANGAWESLRHRSSQIKTVLLADIRIDHRFQRALNVNAMNKIKAEYHPKGTGQILVGGVAPEHDGEARLACLDGQTRVVALGEMQQEIDTGTRQIDDFAPQVTAEVFDELTIEEAALLFRLRNQQRPVPPRDRDRIMVIEGDPIMTEVVRQSAEAGYVVFDVDDPDNITMRSVTEAKMIVRWEAKANGAGLLTRALTIQARAFETPEGTLIGTVDPKVLAATAMLLQKNPNISEDELTRVMAGLGLPALQQMASGKAVAEGTRLLGAVRTILVERYNKNKRGADRISR